MDRIKATTAFALCVERGSLSAVAGETKVASSSPRSSAISAARLARRTRELKLTEEGKRCYERCRAIIDAVPFRIGELAGKRA